MKLSDIRPCSSANAASHHRPSIDSRWEAVDISRCASEINRLAFRLPHRLGRIRGPARPATKLADYRLPSVIVLPLWILVTLLVVVEFCDGIPCACAAVLLLLVVVFLLYHIRRQAVRSRISLSLEAWRGIEHDTQLQWNKFAATVQSHQPPFDGSTHITGQNLFVSAYHGVAKLGEEHVPGLAPWEDFPMVYLEPRKGEIIDEKDLQMTFRCSLPECRQPQWYRVVLKLQLTGPGKGLNGGFLRTFLALSNYHSSDAEVRFLIPDFQNLWPVSGPSYQVHCRYQLIDTQTGHRNIYKKTSFLMEVK